MKVKNNLSGNKVASALVNLVNKKGCNWLIDGFLFGTEIGEGQLKKSPCITCSFGDPHTALMPSIVELDGLLGAAGEIPSVDLEKRAPMRFVIILIVFRALPQEVPLVS